MPCNDKSYLVMYGLGIKECVKIESQAKFSLCKSELVLVKNMLGPNYIESLSTCCKDSEHTVSSFPQVFVVAAM